MAYLVLSCAVSASCEDPDATSVAPDATNEDASTAATDASASDGSHDAPRMIPATRTEVVDHTRWHRLAEGMDPFRDAPANVACDPAATLPELFNGVSAYGVDTDLCNYVTLQQPLLRAITAGETITVRLAHFDLTAPEDSEAHVAVQIDSLAVLDERIPIPSRSQVLVRGLMAPRDIPAASTAYFHVHNHGANSYALISISAGP